MGIQESRLIQQWKEIQKTPLADGWGLYFKIGDDGRVCIERNPSFFQRFIHRKQYQLPGCVKEVAAAVSQTEDKQFLSFCQQIVHRYKNPSVLQRIVRFFLGSERVPQEIQEFEGLLNQRIESLRLKALSSLSAESQKAAEPLKVTISIGAPTPESLKVAEPLKVPIPEVAPTPQKEKAPLDASTQNKVVGLSQGIRLLSDLVERYLSDSQSRQARLDQLNVFSKRVTGQMTQEKALTLLREYAILEASIYNELSSHIAARAITDVPKEALGYIETANRVEAYVRKNLADIVAEAFQTKTSAKRVISEWYGPKLGVVKCKYVVEPGKPPQIEITTAAYFTEGDFKTIKTLVHLAGPKFEQIGRKVYAYGKSKEGEKAKAQLLNELECMDLLRKETVVIDPSGVSISIPPLGKDAHVLLGERVVKHKDPSQTKGILMPFCDRGTYASIPSGFTRETVQSAIDGALGLWEVHLRGLVQMDVKPSNFLRKTDDVGVVHGYLADLGLSARSKERIRKRGSTPFMAPEVVSLEEGRNCSPRPSMDMWSYGLVLVELFFGRDVNAFRNISPRAKGLSLRKTMLDRISKKAKGDVQKAAVELIERLLSVDPSKRPDAKTVADELTALLPMIPPTNAS